MSTHTYTKARADCLNISTALVAAGFSVDHSIQITDDPSDNVTILFPVDLSSGEAEMLDAVINEYDGNLQSEKHAVHSSIDMRTRQLIDAGFIHDGHAFSLSIAAQANWNRMIAQHSAGKLTFPTPGVSTLRGSRHVFVDEAAFEAFEDAYLLAIELILESGRLLKDQVDAATTTAEILAVVDNR